MLLSKNFSFDEMTVTDLGDELQVLNHSDALQYLDTLARLCAHLLEPVRGKFGPVIVSSGFRCEKVNALVGGAPGSQHAPLNGEYSGAADFMPAFCKDEIDRENVFIWCRENLEFHQLIMESNANTGGVWIHAGMPKGWNDQQVFYLEKTTGEKLWVSGRPMEVL